MLGLKLIHVSKGQFVHVSIRVGGGGGGCWWLVVVVVVVVGWGWGDATKIIILSESHSYLSNIIITSIRQAAFSVNSKKTAKNTGYLNSKLHLKTLASYFISATSKTYHHTDVIMSAMASQITSLTTVYSTVDSGTDERKHQISASLAFVWVIHRWRWIPRTKGQ